MVLRNAYFLVFIFATLDLSLYANKREYGYSNLIVFGDSLSDMGNTCSDDAEKRSLFCSLSTNQRFTNGGVWVEHIANTLNLELLPSRLDGYNFAYSGAKTGWGAEDLPGLDRQVYHYLQRVQYKADAEALYVIWIGANDFKDALASSLLIGFDKSVLTLWVENIVSRVAALSGNGAKTFLIPNMAPLYKTPLAHKILKTIGTIVSGISWMPELQIDLHEAKMKTFVQSYNMELSKRLQALEQELDVKIIHLDAFTLFEHVLENYEDYDLESPKQLFYIDRFHPSAVAHRILAEEFAKSL
jgi:phospholipase/lecithinase/hemolysin